MAGKSCHANIHFNLIKLQNYIKIKKQANIKVKL